MTKQQKYQRARENKALTQEAKMLDRDREVRHQLRYNDRREMRKRHAKEAAGLAAKPYRYLVKQYVATASFGCHAGFTARPKPLTRNY